MSSILWAAFAAGVLLAWWFFSPLWNKKKNRVSVILISKMGCSPAGSKDKKEWLSPKRLEKLFAALKKQEIPAILPNEMADLPAKKSVLLLFTGGYQAIADIALPLLKKYGLKAAVVLPAGLIGQYDAWQKAQTGPWQNILTKEQIKELKADDAVAFLSTSLDGMPLNPENDEEALWQLAENTKRLKTLYGVKASGVYFPQAVLPRPAILQAAQKNFPFCLTSKEGFFKSAQVPVFPLPQRTCLARMLWKIK